jgi:hypothetical protein
MYRNTNNVAIPAPFYGNTMINQPEQFKFKQTEEGHQNQGNNVS